MRWAVELSCTEEKMTNSKLNFNRSKESQTHLKFLNN